MFILAIILAVLAVIVVFVGRVVSKETAKLNLKKAEKQWRNSGSRPDDKPVLENKPLPAFRFAVVGIAGLAALFLVLSSFTIVAPKQSGVVVSMGHVSKDTLAPGLHVKAPWSKVVEIDGTTQPDEFDGDACLPARIADGSQSCVGLTIRWSINPEYANRIYQEFRSDDPTQQFRSAVIVTQLKAAVQKTFADYNPISQLKTVGADEAESAEVNFAPDYDAAAQAIMDDMNDRLGELKLAEIHSVSVSGFRLSDSTQKKLDEYIAAIGDTRVARQKEETAKAQARANKELSGSVSNNPNVLVSRCMDSLNEAIVKNYQLPAGFNCWGGSGSVIVPGTNGSNK